MIGNQSNRRSRRARSLGFLASGLAIVGATLVVISLSGTGTAFAGDPPVLPRPDTTPTEPPPPTEAPPTATIPPPPPPTEIPQIINTPVPTATRVPPTNTPVPPTATPQQQVVAGVSALPRTGSGTESGASLELLILGSAMLIGAGGAAGLTFKASRAS